MKFIRLSGIAVFLFLTGILIWIGISFAIGCNTYSGKIKINESRCICIGKLMRLNFENDKRWIGDLPGFIDTKNFEQERCLGFIIEKHTE